VIRMLSAEELEAALLEIGAERYHWNHPFHIAMKNGRLTKPQVQAWALNRYYYQSRIPIKDAAILARMDDPELRRAWRQRIIDHDGERAGEGGIERWLKLTDGLGLDRAYVISTEGVTEMFSPKIIADRVSGMLANYDFVSRETLAYFQRRLDQAPRDADFALDYVKREARRPDEQQSVLDALRFKCDVLWAQLDALEHAYVTPGSIPHGAFRPEPA
jgi:pyrroloquinoline quinone (PQQ) biosynthesis protein C